MGRRLTVVLRSIALIAGLALLIYSIPQAEPSFNGTSPGCDGPGCHTFQDGAVSVVPLGNLEVEVTLSGLSGGNVAGELVDINGVVVDVMDPTSSNPFILTAPDVGHYIINAGFKNPSRTWDSATVDFSTGLACGDLTQFVARCAPNGNIQARLRALGDWTGTSVTISIDGTPHTVPAQVKPDGSASQWKYQEAGTPGMSFTVSLDDPAGCFSDVIVDCAADGPGGWEWEDDASWGTSDLDATVAPTTTKIIGQPAIGLAGNYPNPFNPSTTIRYQLAEETNVSVKVFNMLGQEVATLVNGVQRAGEQSVVWHGTNDFGQAVSSGLYIYRIQAGNVVLTEKMLFMK